MAAQRVRWWAGALVGAVLAPGCGGGEAADKTGGDTIVLQLATIDGAVNGNGQLYGPDAFVDALERESGGRIRVEVTTGYGDGQADAESRLVEAIASGELDGGWPSTRAFAEAGIDGLQAMETPMTITSYAAQAALAKAPAADELLAQLDGSGVVGLGLAVGPLRRPFAVDGPLLAPEDWAGATFRSFNSPVQAGSIAALGAEPVNRGADWAEAAAAGELDGAEFDFAQYTDNGLGAEVPFVTGNVVLWPKMFVLSLNQERYDGLTDGQREVVEAAAEAAVDASASGTYDDSALATDLCEGGVRVFDASDDQLDALATALQPVVQGLADDTSGGTTLEAIEAIVAEHPDADVIEVPDSCRTIDRDASEESAIPDETAPIPDGEYRVEITADEVADFGVSNEQGSTGTWTIKVQDRIFELRCATLDLPGKDCGNEHSDGTHVFETGYLRGDDTTVYFVGDGELLAAATGCELPASAKPDQCFVLDPYRLDWTVDGDHLTFTDPYGFDVPTFVIEPWTRIS